METAKLGKRGQVSIPKAILDKLGIQTETLVLVEATDDGSIVLRPAGVYPIELYSDARVAEILQEDRITVGQQKKLRKRLGES